MHDGLWTGEKMLRLAADRLKQAGYPHLVVLEEFVSPRDLHLWMGRNFPRANASILPYGGAYGDGQRFVVGFRQSDEALAFQSKWLANHRPSFADDDLL